MIRTTAVPGQVRVGAVAASVVGVALLAGCAGAAATESDTTDTSSDTSTETTDSTTTDSGESDYVDGTHTAEGSYSPQAGTIETISVTLTLEDDVITAVEVTGDPQARESEQYQGEFIGGIADVVVGVDIDEISVSKVAGSSLTSGGFNDAVETIKSEAAA